MFNANLPRWIFASISKHFTTKCPSLMLFIEGQLRPTTLSKDWIELRVDGPYLTEVSKGYWKVYSEINVLLSSYMDQKNYHRIHQDAGTVAAAFTCIEIYRYGIGIEDDQSLVGAMQLVRDTRGRERIQISHFGMIDPDKQLYQATVEGHYSMFLES